MTFDQGLDAIEKIKRIIEKDDFLKKVKIRNFNHAKDADDFIRVYNRAFITAPDPYRSLTFEDIKNFDEKSTFVAVLYNRIVGFIFLTIEPLIKSGMTVGKQGVIAGIGVDPRYRRRKIAFLLAAKAAEYFTENAVDELLCEVYFENKISYNFIRNFGFQNTGEIFL
ncbi:MAG: GNAT family N-acetyltransferase [Candidatus Hodarchaeales archaeon]